MRILAVDPGIVFSGWCLAANADYIASGWWKPKSKKGIGGQWAWDMARLQELKGWAKALEARHTPDVLILEVPQFASFGKNIGVAMNASKVQAAAGVLFGAFEAMVRPVTPSQWQHGLKDRALGLKVRSWVGKEIENEHERDACGICIFEIDRNHGFRTTWMGAGL